MSQPSTSSQLAAVATFVWREIRGTLKTQGLLNCVDECRLAGYASIVTSSLVLSVTRDQSLAESCLQQALRDIATEATRWRIFGNRIGEDRERWLNEMNAVVRASRQAWAAELFDEQGRIRVLTLSRAATFVQRQGVQIDPNAASEVCLTMMHSLRDTAQQRIEQALRLERPQLDRRAAI